MLTSIRKSGIPATPEVPLGTHFCHFFETPGELCDVVVPFIVAGIEEGELCLWLTSEPVTESDASEALRRMRRDADQLLATGAVVLKPARDSYLRDGKLDTAALDELWT